MTEQISNLELIDTRELAKLLKVSVSSLGRWRREGYGPRHFPIGPRRVGYRVSDVRAWQEKQAIGGTAPEDAATAA